MDFDQNHCFLSVQHHSEQKFRINLLTNQLPLHAKLFKHGITDTPNCPYCVTEPETQHHLWTCPNTIKIKDEIVDLTYEIFRTLLPSELKHKTVDWETELISRDTFFDPEQDSLYPMYFGFILDIDAKAITKKLRLSLQLTNKISSQLHINLIDAWLYAIYQLVWLPRAKISSDAIKARQLEKRRQQARKRTLRKRTTPETQLPNQEKQLEPLR